MCPIVYLSDNGNIIKPFKKILTDYKSEQFYDLRFIRTIKTPLSYNELNSLIISFVIFFPIYYSMLEIAQNKDCSFKEIISNLNCENLIGDYPDMENNELSGIKENVNINIDETKFVKAGIRWQVFERDYFKCVACGKSAHDGAILHVDHIIPKSKGGSDSMDNYQTLCHLCNIGKGNRSEKNLRK
ncbi:MAG: HNH endonuclease [Spirochaetaceae bacterium]|jgi:hypothetical protein|nr:HNH endonuclease [Spirochaetaceae bacterium]